MPSSAKRRRTPAAKAAAAPKDELRDEPVPITLHGRFPEQIKGLKASNLALLATFGVDDEDREVLVPLLDWQIYLEGSLDDEDEPLAEPALSVILSMENACFLLQDLAGDIDRAMRLLSRQCGGGLLPERGRVQYAANMLRQAATHMDLAAERLETLEASNEAASLL